MSVQQPALLCQYRYDPLDRLINQTQTHAPTHQRFYCKSRLATEIQGAVRHSIVQHGGLLLAQQQREGDVFDTTLLATDLQRSVLHTLDKSPSKQSIAYTPYGHRLAESGLTSLLGFAGERPDSVTGYYLLGNGYRAFNPVLMRFNSPDSLSPFGKGGLNSYAYCVGDPINFIDPTGHGKGFFGSLSSSRRTPKAPSPPKAPSTPIARNTPPPNSLEGLTQDAFRSVTKYLDKADMDILSSLSQTLNENSNWASTQNLKSYISMHKKNKYGLPKSVSVSGAHSSSVDTAGEKVRQIVPPIKGVGSVAFKKVDPGVEGPNSLAEYNSALRSGATKRVMESLTGSEDLATIERDINVSHADAFLEALKQPARFPK